MLMVSGWLTRSTYRPAWFVAELHTRPSGPRRIVDLHSPGALGYREPLTDFQIEVPLLEYPAVLGERGDDDPPRPVPAEAHCSALASRICVARCATVAM